MVTHLLGKPSHFPTTVKSQINSSCHNLQYKEYTWPPPRREATGCQTVVKSLLLTSVASLSSLRVAETLKFKFHSKREAARERSKSEKQVSSRMERSSECQIVASFPTYESFLEQSSILLQTCDLDPRSSTLLQTCDDPPPVSNQALPGMEPSGGAEEDLAPLLQYLDTVNLPQYQQQSEVVHLGEEIIMTVDDPDLIRLAVESIELSDSSSYLEHQTFLEDGLSQVDLEDVDWVPPEEESRRPEPSSGRSKKGEKKHRKGRLQTPLDEIRKENQPNVKRCRVYRSQKKEKEEKKLTDLQQLELENRELKRKEEEVKERRDRVQNAYLALIDYGRIKFSVRF